MNQWNEIKKTQPIVVETIERSFKRGRIAHAYLFEGPKGIKKLDTAIMFAKTYFCLNLHGFNPCNECKNCRRIQSNNHPDFTIIQPDGINIKKEQIKNLQKEFAFSGFESNKKLYIIEHADKMNQSATNSLLKFLEEPNEGTIAILITENIHSMLDTIISRCQKLSFKPLSNKLFLEQLVAKGINRNDAKLISKLTNDLDEALSLNQDEQFHQSKQLIVNFAKEILSGSLDTFISIPEEFLEQLKEKNEIEFGLDLLIIFFNDLLYANVGQEEKIVFADEFNYFNKPEFELFEPIEIAESIYSIMEGKRKIRSNVNAFSVLEEVVISIQNNLKGKAI